MSNTPYLLLFCCATVCLIAWRVMETFDARAKENAHNKMLDTLDRIAENNEAAAKHLAAQAADEARKAEENARIEELKLERTKLLLQLSETDREAFEKLLDEPLVEKTEIKTYYLPANVYFPPPAYYPCGFHPGPWL